MDEDTSPKTQSKPVPRTSGQQRRYSSSQMSKIDDEKLAKFRADQIKRMDEELQKFLKDQDEDAKHAKPPQEPERALRQTGKNKSFNWVDIKPGMIVAVETGRKRYMRCLVIDVAISPLSHVRVFKVEKLTKQDGRALAGGGWREVGLIFPLSVLGDEGAVESDEEG